MSKTIPLTFRPYARLLTMLGDQLIKNERIALIEVIKNAYDADASWVKVTFSNFGDSLKTQGNSTITIEDDGTGMTRSTLEEHWISPATPVKKLGKEVKDVTDKGRKIQGEKGIGRFAILKLGKTVAITTRPKGSNKEYRLSFDFSPYDDDFLTEYGTPKTLFLENLRVNLEESQTATIREGQVAMGHRQIRRLPQGTKIEISNLRGSWNNDKVKDVYKDLIKLQSIFGQLDSAKLQSQTGDFEVFIYKDSNYIPYSSQYLQTLRTLIEQNSVLKIENGRYNEQSRAFTFSLDGKSAALSLDDPDITSLAARGVSS